MSTGFMDNFPFILPQNKEKDELTFISDSMLTLNNDLYSLKENFLYLLGGKLNIRKYSTKLQNWPELEFKEFLKELKKQKVKLTLNEESEWMQYFNEQKQKAQGLQSQITQTDREIDRMVYDLYGLTDEEIKIVEKSVG